MYEYKTLTKLTLLSRHFIEKTGTLYYFLSEQYFPQKLDARFLSELLNIQENMKIESKYNVSNFFKLIKTLYTAAIFTIWQETSCTRYPVRGKAQAVFLLGAVILGQAGSG